MTSAFRRRVVIAVSAAVVVAAGAGVYEWLRIRSRYVREVEGTIIFVDAAKRRAAIELTDPQTGAATEIGGDVPAACPITINDQPAQMSDLRVGDRARVKGRMRLGPRVKGVQREKRVTADWIRVRRGPPTTATAPAAAG